MTPKSLSLDEFLRDPEAGRARFAGAHPLVVMREDEVEDLLDELERLRFVESVKAALASLDRGEGISLEDLEARFEAEEAALLAREADRAD